MIHVPCRRKMDHGSWNMDQFKLRTMDLTLAPGILEQVFQHAKATFPNEACGLLVGQDIADRFIPVKNISPSAQEYEMDPAELIAALRGLRETGERLIAIFHSHPHGPATPSKKDIDRAYYPDAAHLIVSLAELERPRAEAFRIIDGEALPIELRVIV
jgi:proteasome lid subunit RPN8/RPN11